MTLTRQIAEQEDTIAKTLAEIADLEKTRREKKEQLEPRINSYNNGIPFNLWEKNVETRNEQLEKWARAAQLRMNFAVGIASRKGGEEAALPALSTAQAKIEAHHRAHPEQRALDQRFRNDPVGSKRIISSQENVIAELALPPAESHSPAFRSSKTNQRASESSGTASGIEDLPFQESKAIFDSSYRLAIAALDLRLFALQPDIPRRDAGAILTLEIELDLPRLRFAPGIDTGFDNMQDLFTC